MHRKCCRRPQLQENNWKSCACMSTSAAAKAITATRGCPCLSRQVGVDNACTRAQHVPASLLQLHAMLILYTEESSLGHVSSASISLGSLRNALLAQPCIAIASALHGELIRAYASSVPAATATGNHVTYSSFLSRSGSLGLCMICESETMSTQTLPSKPSVNVTHCALAPDLSTMYGRRPARQEGMI